MSGARNAGALSVGKYDPPRNIIGKLMRNVRLAAQTAEKQSFTPARIPAGGAALQGYRAPSIMTPLRLNIVQ